MCPIFLKGNKEHYKLNMFNLYLSDLHENPGGLSHACLIGLISHVPPM